MGEDRQGARTTPPGRKLAVSEAAAELGISAEAVRSRLKRGTLRSVKEGPTVYVLLETDQTPPERARADDQTNDRSPSEHDALISEMRAHNATLQAQLEAERQAHAEARRLLMAALERIPAIEPPQEATEDAETVEEAPEATEPQSDAAGPQTAPQRRPLWRRVFGR